MFLGRSPPLLFFCLGEPSTSEGVGTARVQLVKNNRVEKNYDLKKIKYRRLEGTALGLTSKAEAFFALRLVSGQFWCSLVTAVMFSSNLGNFENNTKNLKK